ncbi:MAG: SGNH/GDSL hydrolase family protein [Gammaproteobacteria bacterium]|nr:SGNH/GDSL hydrolase family protein [Gammaproteobacteria bacterium]
MSDSESPAAWRRWSANLALTLFVLSLMFGLAELALRLAGVSYPNFYAPDPHTGMALRPNASGYFGLEGGSHVEINADGLRDVAHAKEKPPGTLRIAVLGDSYAEAMQVDRVQTFWSVMNESLRDCAALGQRRVEVINFGVSGYGTAQALQTYRYKVRDYDPDIVLLAFLTGNDIRNNLRELELDPLRPYFVLRDGQLLLDDAFLDEPAYRMRQSGAAQLLYAVINHSRVLQLINRVRQILKARDVASAQAELAGAATQGGEAGLDAQVYHAPIEPLWQQAWAVTAALLRTLADEVASDGRRLVVATLSNGIQVHPDPAQRAAFMQAQGLDTLFYPDDRVAGIGRDYGFEVLTLAPGLQQFAQQEGNYLHGFDNTPIGQGHWNALGHRAAGERLASFICARLKDGD